MPDTLLALTNQTRNATILATRRFYHFAMAESSADVEIVTGFASKAGGILLAGGVLAVVAVGARALGLDKVQHHSLAVPLSQLWIIFMFGTFFHVLYARRCDARRFTRNDTVDGACAFDFFNSPARPHGLSRFSAREGVPSGR